jgi:hypothetical protein
LGRLEALIRHQVRTVTGQPALFSVFFEQRHRLDTRYEEEIRFREAEYVAVFEEAVNAAQTAGAMAGIDARCTTESLFGMTNWCHAWFVPGRDDAEAGLRHHRVPAARTLTIDNLEQTLLRAEEGVPA